MKHQSNKCRWYQLSLLSLLKSMHGPSLVFVRCHTLHILLPDHSHWYPLHSQKPKPEGMEKTFWTRCKNVLTFIYYLLPASVPCSSNVLSINSETLLFNVFVSLTLKHFLKLFSPITQVMNRHCSFHLIPGEWPIDLSRGRTVGLVFQPQGPKDSSKTSNGRLRCHRRHTTASFLTAHPRWSAVLSPISSCSGKCTICGQLQGIIPPCFKGILCWLD